MAFVPLRTYSGFSYLQSGLLAEKIPSLAKKMGYLKVGLCDNGSLSGYAPFVHAAEKEKTTPIFGMDAKVSEGTFTLIAKNEGGYRNLCQLSLLYSQGQLTYKAIVAHSSGLIALLPTDECPLLTRIIEGENLLLDFRNLLSPFEESYLGLPYLPNEPRYINRIRNFAKTYSYPLVALPKILYPKKEDAIVLSIVRAISEKTYLTEKAQSGTEHFLSYKEVNSFFNKEEIELTEEIASKCTFTLLRKRGKLLHYENSFGLTSEEYLAKLAKEGLEKRIGQIPGNHQERLRYELNVISKMGYSDYFLIVADYVNFAKNAGIIVGPGRGSGAGSLVSYALNIVDVDPLKFDLLFERFLNPERQSMPDIDVDFSDLRREEVVVYLQKKYGKDKVAHVLATQTIGAKEALSDIGRVYQYKEHEIKLVKDRIQNDRLTLREDYKTSKAFRELLDSDKYYLDMVALAAKIEGLPRQASIHAAGILLNAEPLEDVIPITDNPSVGYIANLEKDYLEEQGFLKMDLLGLKNLTTVEECLSLIKKGGGPSLAYRDIPYDDPLAIKTIASGKTMGLFQLESEGMKRAISTVKPASFEDVAALLALFRPGPMNSIETYARRKNGQENVRYPSPELEGVLKSTYGIIVYQEQVMQIARIYSGFSYSEADLLRRAISKKNADKLMAMKDKFIVGATNKGHSKLEAERIYDLIERFADYGFNKSHAVAYGMLTCQMAYLKSRYPKEFYCAVLNSLPSESAKFKATVSEAKTLSLSLALPDVNASELGFIADGGKIRLPLTSIKNLPSLLARDIVDERRENGLYKDLFDFTLRLKSRKMTLVNLVRLIDAGALDSLCPSRASLRASVSLAFTYAEMICGESGQAALLALNIEKPVMVEAKDDKAINLEAEYEALGMMVSGSPLSLYEDQLKDHKLVSVGEAYWAKGVVEVAAIIKSIRAHRTKRGDNMAFLNIYDEDSEMSLVSFSDTYERLFPELKENRVLLFKIRKDDRREDNFILVDATPLGDRNG